METWGHLVVKMKQMKNGKRPPLGIEPEYIWKSKRLGALCSAIIRYFNEGLPVSEEWLRERNSLIAQGFSPIYEDQLPQQQDQEPTESPQQPESTQDLTKAAWYGVFETRQGDALTPTDVPVSSDWKLKYRVFAEPTNDELNITGAVDDYVLKKGDVIIRSTDGNRVKVIEVELLN